ncbi:MAG: glycine cleavage system aminomethyltransferase GcvT, partial [Alphaproteobacteria bacterium]|nr:glycine cleavage system aminomethyltransferase GcvT [Alphaproteobacteria bacterium]
MSDQAPHSETLGTTPLDALHRSLGGKMVPFAGYWMPVQYPAGIVAEHQHTRQAASLFDVSHMGQVVLLGADAARALESVVPGDIAGLAVGAMRYTMLTNDQGGIIDDLMALKIENGVALVVNASRKDVVLPHLARTIGGRAKIEFLADRALVALQGPKAAAVMARLAPAAARLAFMTGGNAMIGGVDCAVTRSGYTGEDGFEISIPAQDAERVAKILLAEPDVKPAGLGARDSLRLEAGLCLYGQDIDEATTPIEAGLAWTIGKRRRAEGGFPGAQIILAQIKDKPRRVRVGIRPDGRAPVRAGAPLLLADGAPVGTVTSG